MQFKQRTFNLFYAFDTHLPPHLTFALEDVIFHTALYSELFSMLCYTMTTLVDGMKHRKTVPYPDGGLCPACCSLPGIARCPSSLPAEEESCKALASLQSLQSVLPRRAKLGP